MALVIGLHELCHGAAIRAFGGAPRYGVGVVYAVVPYAFATTDTRFTRNQFLVAALAPLVLLTLVGVPAMVLFERPWLAVPLALNADGAVGDVWMALTLLSYPAEVSVVDSETGLELYGPPGLERRETAPTTVVWTSSSEPQRGSPTRTFAPVDGPPSYPTRLSPPRTAASRPRTPRRERRETRRVRPSPSPTSAARTASRAPRQRPRSTGRFERPARS